MVCNGTVVYIRAHFWQCISEENHENHIYVKNKQLLVDWIVSRQKSGKGYKNISAALIMPKSTVVSVAWKWRKFGSTRTLLRSGCLTNLNNLGKRALVRDVTKNPMVTKVELQCSLVEIGEPCRRSIIATPPIRPLRWKGQTEATPH